MSIDERTLGDLISESEDLQLDALATTRTQVAELREVAFERRHDPVNEDEIRRYNESRRGFLQRLGFTGTGLAARGALAGGFGAALAAFVARPASADTPLDIQMLQTASGLETLAVATYLAALELDFIKNGNKVVVMFAETTSRQHAEHGQAFRAQTAALGGPEQTAAHPGGQEIVDRALPGLTGPLEVVQLAEQLETIATQTYLENTALLEDSVSRQLMATVMGVESQHAAVLRAVAALLEGGAPDLIALPVDPAKLPAAAGSVATPDAIEPTTNALPPESGAVAAGGGEG